MAIDHHLTFFKRIVHPYRMLSAPLDWPLALRLAANLLVGAMTYDLVDTNDRSPRQLD